MELSVEDYEKIYIEIETVILAGATESRLKKIKHDYHLSATELQSFEKIYFIASAQIRQGIEKVFNKYIDSEVAKQVQEQVAKRKRGPRRKLPTPDIPSINESSVVSSTERIGNYVVESF